MNWRIIENGACHGRAEYKGKVRRELIWEVFDFVVLWRVN